MDIHDQIDVALGRGVPCLVYEVVSTYEGWERAVVLFDDDPVVYLRHRGRGRLLWRKHRFQDAARERAYQSGMRTLSVRPDRVRAHFSNPNDELATHG